MQPYHCFLLTCALLLVVIVYLFDFIQLENLLDNVYGLCSTFII